MLLFVASGLESFRVPCLLFDLVILVGTGFDSLGPCFLFNFCVVFAGTLFEFRVLFTGIIIAISKL